MEKGKNQLSRYIIQLVQRSAFKQAVFVVFVSAGVAVGLYAYDAIRDSDMRPLDYVITDKNMSSIVDTLEKNRIKYKIDTVNSIVYVPMANYQTAKMKLAAAGVQKDDGVNFSYLSDASSLGESQFVENARYMRALETDLTKTIGAIEGISHSRVHIAMPNHNTFADENEKASASVFLTVSEGLILDREKIKSVIQLVASSVPGLDPKLVSITDQYGHYLSDSISEGARASAEQLAYKNNIQHYYERRVESIIVPLVGKDKVSVKVNANLDFTQIEQAKEEYDPQQKVVRSEQQTSEEVGSSSASGAAGALANTPPTGGASKGGKSSSTQGRQHSIKNYELGKSVTYKKSNYAKVNQLSVAVIVDNERVVNKETKAEEVKPLSKEKVEQITKLVKSTIGFDEKRGDVVTVINADFSVPKEVAAAPKPAFWQQSHFYTILKQIGEALLAFILLFIVYRKFTKHLAEMKKNGGGGGGGGGGAIGSDEDLSPEMLELKNEQINRLKQMSTADPARVALVLKNWVSK